MKACLGSHHSEKTEILRLMQRKKLTFVIGNSNQPSHAKATLTRPQKGLVRSPPWGTVDPKRVAKLLDGLNIHKAPGPDGLNARVLNECSNEHWHLSLMRLKLRTIHQMSGDKQMFPRSLKKVKNMMQLTIDRCRSHASAAKP